MNRRSRYNIRRRIINKNLKMLGYKIKKEKVKKLVGKNIDDDVKINPKVVEVMDVGSLDPKGYEAMDG
jgi:hypothetical protein